MMFDQLLQQVQQRVDEYQRSRGPDVVLGDDALSEVEALWRVAQPADADHPTADDHQRLEAACTAVGWLHFLRFTAQVPPEPITAHPMLRSKVARVVALVPACGWEMARALGFLASLPSSSEMIPEPLQNVLGPAADPGSRAELSCSLMEYAQNTGDPVSIDFGIWLISVSAAATPEGHQYRAGRLANLGTAYWTRFSHGEDMADLSQALKCFQDSVAAMPPDHLDHAGVLDNLGKVMEVFWQVVTATTNDHPYRARYLIQLATAYMQRFERSGDLSDLDRCIASRAQALAVIPDGDLGRAGQLCNHGGAYRTRFAHGGRVSDVDQAIALGRQALAVAAEDHPERPIMLSNLGASCRARFGHSRVPADLDEAVEAFGRAVAATPDDHPHRPAYLRHWADAHGTRYEQGGVPADIDQAIEIFQEVMRATPEDHPDRASSLFEFSCVYWRRYEQDEVAADLDRAIELGTQALDAIPDGYPEYCRLASGLGAMCESRYRRGGLVADLERAIELGIRALNATPENHASRAGHLSNLSLAYQARYRHAGDVEDLEQAIEFSEEAVAAAPETHPEHALCLSNLGGAYRSRYTHRRDPAELDRIINALEQAVASTPENHPRRGAFLGNLADTYHSRYQRSGSPSDLTQAVSLGAQAVAATSYDRPIRAVFAYNLACACHSRFEHSGIMADLEQAIKLGTEALDDAVGGNLDRLSVLNSLGIAYQSRYEETGSVRDLERAIELGVQARDVTPGDHPDLGMCLSNLANAFRLRYKHDGTADDFAQVVETISEAVAVTPEDHPARVRLLSNLANAYQQRFETDGALADVQQAIEYKERAVALTPDDHLNRASMLLNLVSAYKARWRAGGPAIAPETLRALAGQIIAATASLPADRVSACHRVALLARSMHEHDIAVELLDVAVEVLPSVAPWEAGVADQESRLGEHQHVVEEAVAAHCAIGDAVGAVRTAELGRGILLAAQLDSRSDLADLDDAHADMAAALRKVREQIADSQVIHAEHSSSPTAAGGPIEHRKRLWDEHDRLLTRIRQQPGFDRFLRPPRLADLQQATVGGAAILVNTGSRHSDAIIITSDADPVHVPLPDATHDDVHSLDSKFLKALHGDSFAAARHRPQVVAEILGWLWDAVVEPILRALPSAADGTSTPPRVWWIPTGQHMSVFPLHAAGHPGQPGALDAVVSSYIPTLRALAHTRTRPAATVRRQLTVALQQTPTWDDLPRTAEEASALHTDSPGGHLLLDDDATPERVMSLLPDATWAHFACHANVHPALPSHSSLILHGDALFLSEISELNLDHAELAYLSACSTAARGGRLTDESLHLASAFQLAGFRHVIASLWAMNDRIAASAAGAFYQRLPATPTADHAATALHHVIRDLRTEHPGRPDLWAALIHSGP